jgi:hypothetical protein
VGIVTVTELAAGVYELTDEEYFGPQLSATTLSSTGARELLKPGGPARYRHAIDNGTLEIRREFDVGHAVHTPRAGSWPDPGANFSRGMAVQGGQRGGRRGPRGGHGAVAAVRL